MRLRAVIRTYCRVGGLLGRSVGRVSAYVCVCMCAGRLLVNARVLQSPEDGRWLWRGREERRKKEERGMQPEGL